ncbi:hypothetical protein ABIC89_006567 [Variovorax boronicumulans]|uniref:hypothetical protein n=1 Tax=Variovorax boronicumulans TaxID=436515 RepID=UPI00339B72CF
MTPDDVPEEAKPPSLRAAAVPEGARPYLALAQRFGIGDDGYRSEVVENLSEDDQNALLGYRHQYPDAVDAWLCGEESKSSSPSPEYVAFTCLYLAADYAAAIYR